MHKALITQGQILYRASHDNENGGKSAFRSNLLENTLKWVEQRTNSGYQVKLEKIMDVQPILLEVLANGG